jgi:beta-N-acetylhexosaminidase
MPCARRIRRLVVAALALVAIAAHAAAAGPRQPPKPHIVWKPVPFDAARRAAMAAYERRHYGLSTWRLRGPKVIVEHYTANDSFSATWNAFASNAPDPELGELPGTCAHFVVDTDGTIYQLVPLTTACRHTVGLNWTAIGVEHVGTSDAAILSNPRQLEASLALNAWLMGRYGIQLRNLIGHSESVTSPFHKELYAPWHCQTHGDWSAADMARYRAALRRIAVSHGLRPGPPAVRARSDC